MNIRETARKVGGDELVERLDAAMTVQNDIIDKVDDIIGGILDHSKDRPAAAAAVCEALSVLFGKAVAFLYETNPDNQSKTELMVMAIRSLSNNVTRTFEEVALKKSGVSDLIAAAAKKGGGKQDGEGGE